MYTLKELKDRNIPHRTVTITQTRSIVVPVTREYVDKDLNTLSNDELIAFVTWIYANDSTLLVNDDWKTSSVSFTADD